MMAATIALLVAVHDRGWVAPDDGYFGAIAEAILQGSVLHKDVHQWHPGYIHWLHAASFHLVGVDLLSLRYPMIVMQVMAAIGAYVIGARISPLIAALLGFSSAMLGASMLFHATPNWYCTALVIIVGACLSSRSTHAPIVGGAAIGLLLGLRPVSGALVAVGAAHFWLASQPEGRRLYGQLLLACLVSAYVLIIGGLTAFLLIGLGPLLLTFVPAVDRRIHAFSVSRISVGAAGALLPLVVYGLVTGTITALVHNTTALALRMATLDFRLEADYLDTIVEATRRLTQFSSGFAVAEGIYWLLLFALPPVCSVVTAYAAGDNAIDPRTLVTPWIATFYSASAVYYAIPHYWLYIVGPCAVGLIVAAHPGGRIFKPSVGLLLMVVGLTPLVRFGRPLIWQGQPDRRDPLVQSVLERASLKIPSTEHAQYAELLQAIEPQLGPNRAALILPNSPEIFFLGRYTNPAGVLTAPVDLDASSAQRIASDVQAGKFDVVIHKTRDKYNQPWLAPILGEAKRSCRPTVRQGDFVVYSRCGHAPGASRLAGFAERRAPN